MKINANSYAVPDIGTYTDGANEEKQSGIMAPVNGMEDMITGQTQSFQDNFYWSIEAEKSKNNFEFSADKPGNNAPALLMRLVAATGQFEVRMVIADTAKDLAKLRMAQGALTGKDAEETNALIERLGKIISRAQIKIRNLNREDDMKLQHTKAKVQKQEKRAREIKEELRKHIRRRKEKENEWIRDDAREQTGSSVAGVPGNVSEAGLTALAHAMAAAEMTSAGFGELDAGLGDFGGAADGGGAEGFADVSVDGGGAEVSVE